jgi:DNA-directed RNA polymerase specialized sigma24 family protein
VLQDRRATARHPLVVDSEIVEGMEGMEQVYDLFDEATGPWHTRTHRVRHCIGQLNDNLKTTLLAVYGREETIRQTATRMEISFDAVAKR